MKLVSEMRWDQYFNNGRKFRNGIFHYIGQPAGASNVIKELYRQLPYGPLSILNIFILLKRF